MIYDKTDVEGELIQDRNGDWLWRTASGQEVAINQMQDSHLRNAALFLMGMGYRKCTARDGVRVVWLRIFAVEWKRRMLRREQEQNKRWRSNQQEDSQKELENIINGRKLRS